MQTIGRRTLRKRLGQCVYVDGTQGTLNEDAAGLYIDLPPGVNYDGTELNTIPITTGKEVGVVGDGNGGTTHYFWVDLRCRIDFRHNKQ
jgi:hypothetical protein